MTDDAPHTPATGGSRRRFLAAAATAGTAATAGCLGSLLGSSTPGEIEPEEPSTPRAGTPGEFYTFLERNDVVVESLRWDGDDLVLEYPSSAETVDDSEVEIEVVTTVYNEILVKHDADVEMLYAEITDPIEDQALGWGVKTEWCETYNESRAVGEETDGDGAGLEDVEGGEDEGDDGGTVDDETDDGGDVEEGEQDDGASDDADGTGDAEGDEDDAEGGEAASPGDGDEDDGENDDASFDAAAMVLMSNVLSTRVYEEDLDDESAADE